MAGGKKTVRSKVASGSSQSRQKPATLSSDVACAVCSKVVTESTPSCRGDDALQCDGCHLWFHRWCTGVSTCHYSSLSVSDVPFLCFVCLQKEFISLRDTVSALRLESAQLKSALSDIEANRVENPPDVENLSDGVTYAHVVSKSQLSSNNVPPSVPPNSEDRRCNLVISGIPECPQGTRQTSRALLDQDSIMSILSPLCPSLAIPSIKHFLRLGKYQPIRSRPILLKLHRPLDASVILSNVRRLSSSPGISIRHDLSSSDREVRSILLKERRSLLSSGVKPQDVRISASRLFLRRSLHGEVVNKSFVRVTSSTVPSSTSSSTTNSAPLLSTPVLPHNSTSDSTSGSFQ